MSEPLFFRRIVYAMVIGLLPSISATLGNQGTKPALPHRLLLTGKSHRVGAIELELRFHKMHGSKETPIVREWGWGCGDPYDIAIRSLRLSVGETRVKVPPEAYANLLN